MVSFSTSSSAQCRWKSLLLMSLLWTWRIQSFPFNYSPIICTWPPPGWIDRPAVVNGPSFSDNCWCVLQNVAIRNNIWFRAVWRGQKSSSVSPTLLDRQSALLASLVHAMGDKWDRAGRLCKNVFHMKVFTCTLDVSVKRRIHRFRDVCGQCLSITGALAGGAGQQPCTDDERSRWAGVHRRWAKGFVGEEGACATQWPRSCATCWASRSTSSCRDSAAASTDQKIVQFHGQGVSFIHKWQVAPVESPSDKQGQKACNSHLKGICANPLCNSWHLPVCHNYKSVLYVIITNLNRVQKMATNIFSDTLRLMGAA